MATIAEVLAGITIANGYDYDVVRVYRTYRHPRAEPGSLPYVCLIDGDEDDRDGSEGAPVNFYEALVDCRVYGMIQVGDPDDPTFNPSTILNNFFDAIRRRLVEDPRLKGGTPTSVCDILRLRGGGHGVWTNPAGVGACEVRFQVQYLFRDEAGTQPGIDGPFTGRG